MSVKGQKETSAIREKMHFHGTSKFNHIAAVLREAIARKEKS